MGWKLASLAREVDQYRSQENLLEDLRQRLARAEAVGERYRVLAFLLAAALGLLLLLLFRNS